MDPASGRTIETVTGDARPFGDTVRRTAQPWSASVQAVLRHLQRAGISGVPLPLGFDELGREVVSYVAGDVWDYPLPEVARRDSTLVATAVLLRRLHDATVGFEPPADARWMLTMPGDLPAEVVCHNDLAPNNTVYSPDGVGLRPRIIQHLAHSTDISEVRRQRCELALGCGTVSWNRRRALRDDGA